METDPNSLTSAWKEATLQSPVYRALFLALTWYKRYSLESRWGVDSGSGTRLCSAFLFPRPSRFRVCAVFVLGPTEFRARRVRAGVELEAGWSGPSSSPVRGRLLFSGPFPCGWGNQGLGATLVRRRAKSVGARAASPGSWGLTQIPGSHPELPCLHRLGKVCVIVKPDPQEAGNLTGLHDGVWGSTAPFPTAEC